MVKRLVPVLLLALLAGACGDDGGVATTTAAPTTTAPTTTVTAAPPTTGGAAAATVEVASFSFTPADVAITVGDSVAFTWASGTHTVTARDGSFDSGPLSSGATFTAAFATAGTFEYFCNFHASMRGTITVSG